ncbi:MAG: hypothetical protein B7C24_18185, partial [Bacteroidetes bacterium 4572_77]
MELPILPATKIEINQSRSLDVYGDFFVQGIEDHLISFVSNTGNFWEGINLLPFSTSNFQYSIIDKADIGINAFTCSTSMFECILSNNNIGLFMDNCGISDIKNSTFENNLTTGIKLKDSSPQLSNNIIRNNLGNGLHILDISFPDMSDNSNNQIYSNTLNEIEMICGHPVMFNG